tara:strand:- start:109 stop:666 length:558 start_codon:yes stop_codon:yes gene_type:complete
MNKKINREQAILILKKMVSNKSLFIHSMSIGIVMEEYAYKLNEDKDEFFITGILHDADYEKFPDQHPKIIVNKLYELNQTKIAHAISCHYSKWNVICENNLDKYLLACDEITGFIVACTKVRPDGITSLKSKSVLKNLRKKSFAASVERDEIYLGSKLINKELKDHIDFIIEALKKNSDILELKT